VAATVHVARVAGSAENGPVDATLNNLPRNEYAALLAGDGIIHSEMCRHQIYFEHAAVADIKHTAAKAAAGSKREALTRDAVGRVQDGAEHELVAEFPEDAEQWRLPVVGAEEAEELWVGEEPSPALAGGGGAREG
jgi:hypothetical protein